MDLQNQTSIQVGELGPNPIQFSNTDAAVSMGHVLHPMVGGQPWRPTQGMVREWLHCGCTVTRKLVSL